MYCAWVSVGRQPLRVVSPMARESFSSGTGRMAIWPASTSTPT